MPYSSMEQAKKAGAKTMLDDCPLSLTQINKMAEMADAMKAEGKVDNPWAVAVSNFKKTHKIENGRWVKKEMAKEALALLEKMSFDDMRRAISNKLSKPEVQPMSSGYSYMEDMYDDGTCIVRTSKDGAESFVQYKYSFDKDGNVSLTNPQKVERTWAKVKESQGAFSLKKAPMGYKQNIHETLSLSEGQVLPDTEGKKSNKAWWPLLKVGPGNKRDKNYYTQKALESLGERLMLRPKMFFDHVPGDVRPTERNVKDWAASIKEKKIENGVLFGLVQAYDPWLKERMYDAPDELAASIEARGKANGTIDHEGEKWNAIESVPWLNAVNIVDYPGNAPMGVTLTERDSDQDDPQEDKLETIAELKEKFPAVYEQVVNETKTAVQAELKPQIDAKDAEIKKLKESQTADAQAMTSLKESMTKMEAKIDGMEALGKKKDRDQKVAGAMAKLPAEAVTDKFRALVESAKDEPAALEMIEERAKLFEGKVLGHGKTDPPDATKAAKERETIFLHSLGQKTEEEIEAERKAKEGK